MYLSFSKQITRMNNNSVLQSWELMQKYGGIWEQTWEIIALFIPLYNHWRDIIIPPPPKNEPLSIVVMIYSDEAASGVK